MERNGQLADVNAFMPLVLINPEIKPYGDMIAGSGRLFGAFPKCALDISRPSHVEVKADAIENGDDRSNFKAGGLLSRALQHEVDHLNGILFIDRMTRASKDEVQEDIAGVAGENEKVVDQV